MEESLEVCFDKLNGIISEMDNSNVSLDEAFAKYDEGMKLVKACKEKLDMYEKKIITVNEGNNND